MEDANKLKSVTQPVYQKIAADIAAKIADKQYQVGEKIYTRSSIASQYSVSSETARRAICILADLDIVAATKGSGVTILSHEKAAQFLQQFHDVQTVDSLKKALLESIGRQQQELEQLKEQALNLVDKAERFRLVHPFTPFEIVVPLGECTGKTITELCFWQHTAATVIAIRRGDSLLLSPGPYAALNEGDRLYFVGDEGVLDRVRNFLAS